MLALGLLASLVGPPPDAVPEPPVRWDAPPGCPDVQVVSDRIGDLLGHTVQPGEIELTGSIKPAGTGWRLELETRVGAVEDARTLDADDCSVLADAAALVAVVMLDPVLAASTIETRAAAAAEVTEELEETQPEGPPEIPEAETKREEEEEPKPKPPPKKRRWDRPPPRKRQPGDAPGVWLRLRAGGEFGAIPGGTGGFEVTFAIGGDRIRGELAGAYWIGRNVESSNGNARVHLGTATPRLCGMITAGPIDIPLCAGIELGAMRADPSGSPVANRFWVAAQAEPGVRWAFSKRVSLWVAAQAFIPIRYPRFQLTDATGGARSPEPVYQPSAAGLRGLAGLEFRLSGTERGR